jgi:hypothetical protein
VVIERDLARTFKGKISPVTTLDRKTVSYGPTMPTGDKELGSAHQATGPQDAAKKKM